MAKTRVLLALGAFFVLAGALSACGGDSVPGNAVIRVGDSSIKKTTFTHWMNIAAISSQQALNPNSSQKPQPPQPPNFSACVAEKAKTAPKPAKGQPTPTTAQFKAQCKQEYEGLRDQVLQFLVSSQWIINESADQGVKVTDAEVNKQFQQTKKQSFPKEKDFQKYLANSGMSVQDLLFRVRGNLLSDKLRTKITKGKDKVTDAQVADYYKKNKARFASPERRDLRVVLTKDKAKADAARAAIAGGQSFAAVAKRFSIDQSSKSQGGKLLGIAKGQQEKALDNALFAAKKGVLTGPVKTQFGYYVFKVQKITPASQQTQTQAAATIKQLLVQQNQQKALDDFVKNFQKKWKDKTNCREGFIIQSCKNAPKPKTAATSTVPPGGVPQTTPQTTTGK
jgi:foldase protein PrsA